MSEENKRRKQAENVGEDGRLKKTEENIKAIEELLRKNGEMSTAELAKKLGLSKPRTRAILSSIETVIAVGNTTKRKYKLNV